MTCVKKRQAGHSLPDKTSESELFTLIFNSEFTRGKRAKIPILYEIRFILGGYHVDIRCIVTAFEQTIR